MEWTQQRTRRHCPQCGSKRTATIVYGYPSGELFEASERGEAFLGGCVFEMDSPGFGCSECPTGFWADRRFQTQRGSETIDGVAVWPAGRGAVTVELTGAGVLIAEPGNWSVLIPEHSRHGLLGVVWQDIWGDRHDGPAEWARKRGVVVDSVGDETAIEFPPSEYTKVQLLGLKDWLRSLGRSPFDALVERLTRERIEFIAAVGKNPRDNPGR